MYQRRERTVLQQRLVYRLASVALTIIGGSALRTSRTRDDHQPRNSGHNEREEPVIQVLHLGDIVVDETQLADLCRRYQVRELSLFGSAARGEMRPDSDIDLLVEFLPKAEIGLVEHAGLMLDLERLLGRKVDLVSKNALKPRIRPYVLADARLVYAA